jgi:alkaline phosphatase D
MDRHQFEQIMTRGFGRRRLLAAGAGALAFSAVSFPGAPTRAVAALQTSDVAPESNPTFAASPYSIGVASGDPLPDSVVLWTRLAPEPLAADGSGGMAGRGPIEVRYEVATDDAFADIVQSGTALAKPELAHSVHVDLTGLEPATEYFYRFMAGNELSPVGRTKTAPAAGAVVDRLRFAFAYRHMAQDDLDLVIHLGDYIYEGGITTNPATIRRHNSPEIISLADYRNRYALYKTDPNLQAAHAAFPWAVTWDDHEVDNNWTGDHDQDGLDPALFLPRRAEAFQAYYEHMPLRLEQKPVGPDMLLYRRLTWGDLAEFNVLDTRQYRTDHPCGDGVQVACPAGRDPEVTLLGPEQERWLLDGLDASRATWNVLAQQIMAAAPDRQAGEGQKFGQDSWNGYPAARDRIFGHLLAYEIPNPIVITGDVHAYWVNDLKANFFDPDSATVGVEFVGTSISSNGDEDPTADPQRELLAESPFVKFLEGGRRGYVRCDVTPTLWRSDLQAVENVHDPEAGIETLAAFVTQAGNPGIEIA